MLTPVDSLEEARSVLSTLIQEYIETPAIVRLNKGKIKWLMTAQEAPDLPQHYFPTFSPSIFGKQHHPIIVSDPQHSRLYPLSFGVEVISKHIQALLRLVKTKGCSLKTRAVDPTVALSTDDILAQDLWSCRQIFATLYCF
ncbi:hypothetical protein CU097_010537, partial [Rhizopus azygosporus]